MNNVTLIKIERPDRLKLYEFLVVGEYTPVEIDGKYVPGFRLGNQILWWDGPTIQMKWGDE